MLRTITLFLALTATAFGQNSEKDEAQVWELEKAYWEYVKPTTWRSIARCGTRILLAGHLSVPRPYERITSPTGLLRTRPKGSSSSRTRLGSSPFRQRATSRSITIELTQRGRTAQAPKSKPTECGSRTRGLERTARGKSSVACPRP